MLCSEHDLAPKLIQIFKPQRCKLIALREWKFGVQEGGQVGAGGLSRLSAVSSKGNSHHRVFIEATLSAPWLAT